MNKTVFLCRALQSQVFLLVSIDVQVFTTIDLKLGEFLHLMLVNEEKVMIFLLLYITLLSLCCKDQ